MGGVWGLGMGGAIEDRGPWGEAMGSYRRCRTMDERGWGLQGREGGRAVGERGWGL